MMRKGLILRESEKNQSSDEDPKNPKWCNINQSSDGDSENPKRLNEVVMSYGHILKESIEHS